LQNCNDYLTYAQHPAAVMTHDAVVCVWRAV